MLPWSVSGGQCKAMHTINTALGLNTSTLPFNMGTKSSKKWQLDSGELGQWV